MSRRLLGGLLLLATAVVAAAQDRRPPYWASLSAGEVLMRAGPGKQYPALWLYKREGLPVRVVGVHESWRRVREADGTEGWMLATLLTAERTAVVRPGAPRPLRAEPAAGAPVRYLAQPGVVGRVSDCADGWCRLDVGGRSGHVSTDDLWGVEPEEELD